MAHHRVLTCVMKVQKHELYVEYFFPPLFSSLHPSPCPLFFTHALLHKSYFNFIFMWRLNAGLCTIYFIFPLIMIFLRTEKAMQSIVTCCRGRQGVPFWANYIQFAQNWKLENIVKVYEKVNKWKYKLYYHQRCDFHSHLLPLGGGGPKRSKYILTHAWTSHIHCHILQQFSTLGHKLSSIIDYFHQMMTER